MRGAVGVSPQFLKTKVMAENYIYAVAVILPICYILAMYFTTK